MQTVADVEWREVALSPHERATARDSYVREFERQFRDWSGIAQCCLDVQRDRDWELLGFHSFNHWLNDAAPWSARYIYLSIEIFGRLVPDLAPEELAQVPIGAARLLAGVSKTTRRDARVKAAARKGKRELRKFLAKECPNEHIDSCATLQLSEKLYEMLVDGTEVYTALTGEGISVHSFIEFLLAEWMTDAGKEQAKNGCA